jgi:hypothetical protein
VSQPAGERDVPPLNEKAPLTLLTAQPSSFKEFTLALQDAFSVAAIAEFGHPLDEPIPSDDDVAQSLSAPGSVAHWMMANGERVGGAVVSIDEESRRNTLSFFFVSTKQQSRGLGLRAWQAIEKAYPSTKVWETVTPYFEKRNIHFYVNKCGFKIVEFYNKSNPDPHHEPGLNLGEEDSDEMFRFEKNMG